MYNLKNNINENKYKIILIIILILIIIYLLKNNIEKYVITSTFDSKTYKILNPSENRRSYSSIWIQNGQPQQSYSNLYSNSAWTTRESNNQYMTIDLGKNKLVEGAITKSSGQYNQGGIKTYSISVSTNNIEYLYISQTGTTKDKQNAIVYQGIGSKDHLHRQLFHSINMFKSPINIRYIRFHPINIGHTIALELRL